MIFTCGFESPFFSTAVGEELAYEVDNSEKRKTTWYNRLVSISYRKLGPLSPVPNRKIFWFWPNGCSFCPDLKTP